MSLKPERSSNSCATALAFGTALVVVEGCGAFAVLEVPSGGTTVEDVRSNTAAEDVASGTTLEVEDVLGTAVSEDVATRTREVDEVLRGTAFEVVDGNAPAAPSRGALEDVSCSAALAVVAPDRSASLEVAGLEAPESSDVVATGRLSNANAAAPAAPTAGGFG